jgi:hypothetical protein
MATSAATTRRFSLAIITFPFKELGSKPQGVCAGWRIAITYYTTLSPKYQLYAYFVSLVIFSP